MAGKTVKNNKIPKFENMSKKVINLKKKSSGKTIEFEK